MIRAVLLLALLLPQDSNTLKPIREKHKLPGMIAYLVTGDGIVVREADGVRKRGEDAPITVDDRVHLGSCTKSMTATMIATLVEEKKLAWTTTIGEVFKDVAMHEDWKAVTLEQLLTNRSGAPTGLDKDGLWTKLWSMTKEPRPKQRRALVEGVLKNAPAAPPGTKYLYSNAGFSIAGAMAEQVTGEAWEDLMRRRLFEPLGMTTAGFGAPGTKDKLDEPRGHPPGGKGVEPGPGADNPPAIGPAGIVHCSFADWAKYVAVHLRFDVGGTRKAAPGMEKFLKLAGAAALQRLHEPPKDADPKYAMGWVLADRDWGGGTVLTHNGSNTMWYVVAWLAPKRDFAVLVGTNEGGDAAAKACDEAAAAFIRQRK